MVSGEGNVPVRDFAPRRRVQACAVTIAQNVRERKSFVSAENIALARSGKVRHHLWLERRSACRDLERELALTKRP